MNALQPFHWSEVLLIIWPIMILILLERLVKPFFARFTWYRPSLAELVLPTLWVVIHVWSVKLFGFSLGTLALYVGTVFLVFDLYDYIRQIERFDYSQYAHQAGRILFMTWSCFIFGFILLRVVGIFI